MSLHATVPSLLSVLVRVFDDFATVDSLLVPKTVRTFLKGTGLPKLREERRQITVSKPARQDRFLMLAPKQ